MFQADRIASVKVQKWDYGWYFHRMPRGLLGVMHMGRWEDDVTEDR